MPENQMVTLHLFTDDTDTVVAASIEDAKAVMHEEFGIDMETLDDAEWTQIEDKSEFTINFPDDDPPHTDTKTARQWADDDGRGHLCSTEY